MIDLSLTSKLRADVNALIQEVSRSTILPRFKSLADGEIKTKSGPNDLVTIADEEAEEKLTAGLSALLTGSLVIGEEAAAADMSVLDRLDKSGAVWIIDPIDGTANFVAGNDDFGVIVALVENGETIMGWIHQPIINQTIWAGRGQGTWIDDHRLTLQSDDDIALSNLAASIYHRAFKPALSEFKGSKGVGSAAIEYWSLADGTSQLCTFSNLNPWDHAAGVLIHQEAGGYSAFLEGDIYKPAVRNKRGILSAPSKKIWDRVRALADETQI